MSKKPNPNDDPLETLYNGFNPILSSIGKRHDEGGEIQSDDKLMQTIMNLIGTFLSDMTKKTDDSVQSHNVSDIKEVVQTLLNSDVMSNFVSVLSDINSEGLQTLTKGYKSLFSEIGK